MAKKQAETGAPHAIIPADKRQLQRQPNENESAYTARIAYCKLDPQDRTIAGAYRAVKGMDPGAEVKVPGYFGAYAKRFRWKEYASAWDAYFNNMAVTRRDEKLAAARRETVEQAEQLQALISQEIERLQEDGRRRRLWPGASSTDRTADLATALERVARARISAIAGNDPGAD